LIGGLVEIQRGYNIDEVQGLEEGQDMPICMGFIRISVLIILSNKALV
jgi:hypothetical protein